MIIKRSITFVTNNRFAGGSGARWGGGGIADHDYLGFFAAAEGIGRVEAAPLAQPAGVVPVASHDEEVDARGVEGEVTRQHSGQVLNHRVIAVVLPAEACVEVDTARQADIRTGVGSSPAGVDLVVAGHDVVPGRVADVGDQVVHEGDRGLLLGAAEVAQEGGVDAHWPRHQRLVGVVVDVVSIGNGSACQAGGGLRRRS